MRPWIRTLGLAALLVFTAHPAHAAWLWDQDSDKLDDRMERVESEGLTAAHVGNTLAGRLRFAVMNAAAPFQYGVYVGYDHHPTDADAAALAALGVPVQVRYRSIPYIRTQLTFALAQQVAALPGVTRIETIPIFYAVNDIATRTLRARGAGYELFPAVWPNLGVNGEGVVVAIFDTGVNDAPNGTYPGHQSLRGKWVGGGEFFAGQPLLNTPLDQSINPRHNVDPEATYHGTHVAGTAIGTGGPEGILGNGTPGFNAGLAPGARLVDCKVLSDAGLGFGSADALDWLIHNRHNTWGLTGADSIYWGVDVANLSLGSSDASDGTDANCLAVNAAHRAGIVVCVASGNDGNTAYMPSPAAADLALTVGSFTDENTIDRLDDYVADYSNEGPRTTDGDADVRDEMKPNVMGSGTGIMSSLGDPTTAGDQYHHINGTSMACPSVAGVVALVLSANPTLSADQVRDLIMDTADHRTDGGQQPPSAADPFQEDANYHPSWGWGQADAYAAVKEAQNRTSTQVVRIGITPLRGPDGLRVDWVSQREVGLARFELDRAADAGGAPGAWSLVNTQAVPAPATQVRGVPNRHAYSYTDIDAALDPAALYWYRVRWVDAQGFSHSEPPVSGRIIESPVAARVSWSWTHDYSNGDLYVRFGSGTNTASPAWFRQAPGSPAADSIVTRPGVASTGTLQHYFHVDLTAADLVGGFLPPSNDNPWFLSVLEGGYVNTNGRVEAFAVTVFNGPSSTTFSAPNPPTPTIEKQETIFWIPLDPATQLNHAPVLSPIGPRSVGEGLALTFQAMASDPDGQPLTYSASGLPSGATFDVGSRVFQWTPSHSQAGSYSVRVRARDNAFPTAAADSEDVVITVVDRAPGSNLPPVLASQSDRPGVVGERLRFRVMATDPENGTLTFAAIGLPAGATFGGSSGLLDWVPAAGQEGLHPVTFTVSDGALADSESVYLVISAPGDSPPPPVACDASSSTVFGIVGMGIDPGPKSYTYHPLTVPPNTQRLESSLSWLIPVRDLDFHLLDSDSNEVASAASTADPESFIVTNPPAGDYILRVTAFLSPDTCHYSITTDLCVTPTLDAAPDAGRLGVMLAAPAPNPFRTACAIRFSSPRSGQASLRLYDIAGRQVRSLHEGPLAAGPHVRVWDGRDDRGARSRAGVYFYRFEVESAEGTRRVVRRAVLVD